MCGIFACLGEHQSLQDLNKQFNKIQHRGPDHSETLQITPKLWFGFHRLAINGLDSSGNQPLQLESSWLMCNGEIYNFHQLAEEYGFKYKSNSDCEVILHLYHKFGFEETVKLLDGVFAIILYDSTKNLLWIANDPLGIRPLYWGFQCHSKSKTSSKTLSKTSFSKKTNKHEDFLHGLDLDIFFASEPFALDHCDFVDFFTPGTICCLDLSLGTHSFIKPSVPSTSFSLMNSSSTYFPYKWTPSIDLKTYPLDWILEKYKFLLTRSVEKRLMSDRPIAALLSGGLDSSLICAIISKELKKKGEDLEKICKFTPELAKQQELLGGKLNTFSIGMPGSPDLKYAQLVADHIGSTHHHVEISEEEFLEAIPEVVRAIGSWDITTVRASVGNYLIAKYIKTHTDFTVIFNGDVSEEINGSYYYSKFAPSPDDFFRDNVKLLREIHQYDVLRSARCLEHHSLESRTPFEDFDLVQFVMSIDPQLKMFGQKDKESPMYQPIEKFLLRKAFDETDLLPKEVLWRPKTAFSDGVSKSTRSWHDIIREWAEKLVSDKEFEDGQVQFQYHFPPPTKEAYLYRKYFEEVLPGHARMIKGYWMPRFLDNIMDPSARVLPCNET